MTDSGCFGLATDALARIVVIDYTREQDFDGADLVLDGFGRPDAPVSVLPNVDVADSAGVALPADAAEVSERLHALERDDGRDVHCVTRHVPR